MKRGAAWKLVLWCAALTIAAALLVTSGYQSRDPDSSLYARLSGELARQPASRWIAPEWGGAWNQQGLFREHPVGILLPSVLLIRAGVPDGQAAYIANMLYQVAVITLLPLVALPLLRGVEARSLAWVLQLMPLAFVYRIRGNQEHPLLMCFLAILFATERSRTNPAWILLTVGAFCGVVLVKGAFAMFALVAAALWLLLVPLPSGGVNRWGWVGLVTSAAAAALMMSAYEALYVRTTGESFMEFYGSTRLGASMDLGDPGVVLHAVTNVGWYLLRLAWFAVPWSLVALAVVVLWVRGRRFDQTSSRGLQWSVATTAVFILVLSPALVRAERFIFPTYFIVGAIGVAAAIRYSPRMRALAESADAYPSLPVAVWLVTFLLSLGSRLM